MVAIKKSFKKNSKRLSLSQFKSSAFFAFFLGCGVGFSFYSAIVADWQISSKESAPIRACFSPKGQCTNLIVSTIDAAKSSIFVMAYSFTSPQIAKALGEAHERGIDVKLLIDKSQLREKYSQIYFLSQKGIPTFIDSAQGIAHNKSMIIDDPSLALIYKNNWENRVTEARKMPL